MIRVPAEAAKNIRIAAAAINNNREGEYCACI